MNLLSLCAGAGVGALLGAAMMFLSMRLHQRRLVAGVKRAAELLGTKPGVIFAKNARRKDRKAWRRKHK